MKQKGLHATFVQHRLSMACTEVKRWVLYRDTGYERKGSLTFIDASLSLVKLHGIIFEPWTPREMNIYLSERNISLNTPSACPAIKKVHHRTSLGYLLRLMTIHRQKNKKKLKKKQRDNFNVCLCSKDNILRINPVRLKLCHKGMWLPVFLLLQIEDSAAQVLLDYCAGCVLANYSAMQEK